ncbi:hypothetical protein P7F88_01245 [Vibrio hannami]|uniref:hypothetical protein n=1 Tax=Vibrio hannami TaxID=2717094 RepID=UPI0024104029|nr:hypothetical protein [Vibrio hannami]MDG3084788.1 hypothetical protein [Vibrio hannami]
MIIVVVFVLVVMGMLAANMSRIGWSNQDTLTREYLGAQAWFLAHSGNEWALTTLFPINETDSTADLASRCTAINGQTGIDAATALAADMPCAAPTITCTAPLDDGSIPAELQYYNVTTTAVCGDSTIFQVQRMQEVWAKGVK